MQGTGSGELVWLAVAVTGILKVNSKPLVKYQHPSIHNSSFTSFPSDQAPTQPGQDVGWEGTDGYLSHRYRTQSTIQLRRCRGTDAKFVKSTTLLPVQNHLHCTAVWRFAWKIGVGQKGEGSLPWRARAKESKAKLRPHIAFETDLLGTGCDSSPR